MDAIEFATLFYDRDADVERVLRPSVSADAKSAMAQVATHKVLSDIEVNMGPHRKYRIGELP